MATKTAEMTAEKPLAMEGFYEEPLPGQADARQPDSTGDAPEVRAGRVLIDGEPYSVVQGDLLVDDDELDFYRQQQQALQAQMQAARSAERSGFAETAITAGRRGEGALVGIVHDGRIVRWSPGTILSYCVLRQTFPRVEWYEEVVDNMRAATAAWEETCGIRFEYRGDLDESSALRPPGILFTVRHISANGAFIAAAFFPNDPGNRRRVLIDPSYFTTRFDHVGVLRHELGHVLGFRHEHIRSGAPPVCPDESTTGTIDLTAYDPRSVMHYFCGDVGSRDLQITDVDRAGCQQVYGPPLGGFELLDA